MKIDHIFIFSHRGKEADELIKFGLTEGSGQKHKGIGTANRRIFFENFYLEVLWVENETEARSVDEIGIWERSNFTDTGYSKFGICLENTDDTDKVFKNSIRWHPSFLAVGKYVNILTNNKMPWIFQFPKTKVNENGDEPRRHAAKITRLTKATFKLRELGFEDCLDIIKRRSEIEFTQSPEEFLILEFDNGRQGKEKLFENLSLKIVY